MGQHIAHIVIDAFLVIGRRYAAAILILVFGWSIGIILFARDTGSGNLAVQRIIFFIMVNHTGALAVGPRLVLFRLRDHFVIVQRHRCHGRYPVGAIPAGE
ncbi:hypothetical protein SDC9_119706 [bioreactor metagenome]|uniref:Uncharacterized protein n=1 Tax=bioreactor metagenome TaxID=1076179 RepID=A0A645C4N8_9ZZZZ